MLRSVISPGLSFCGTVVAIPLLSLSFITLRLFTSTNQLFCPMFLIWVCLMFSHDWTEVIHFGQEYHKTAIVSLLVHHITVFLLLICHITNDVKLDRSIKVVSAGVLHRKVSVFPL